MSSKGKKETIDNEDLRKRTVSLIEKAIFKKLTKDIATKIEEGIEIASTNEEFSIMLYTILSNKVL
jgi:hypothetical protein